MIRIRAERLRRGWSQHEVARRSGIHPAEVSRIENRRTVLFPGYARRLSLVLGIPASQLLEDVDLEVVDRESR